MYTCKVYILSIYKITKMAELFAGINLEDIYNTKQKAIVFPPEVFKVLCPPKHTILYIPHYT